MTRPQAGMAVAIGLALALATGPARSAPPQVKQTSPLGLQRGVESELTISGGNLAGKPQLVAPFAFTPPLDPTPGSDANTWKLKLTVAPETPLGVYLLRVRTDDGLSNPFLFAVGQVQQVAEKEENSVFESAQAIPSPSVVEGTSAGNDVDFFRFPGKKGQRILIDAQCARIGSGVDPMIRLTTAGRAFVASADDSPGLVTDARLTAVLPEDGDYVVELSDSRYQGGAHPVYRLTVGPLPSADEVYPLGGRSGETVGLELRGGTLGGTRVAAATFGAIDDARTAPVRVTGQAVGLGNPGEPSLDVESMPTMVVGDAPEVREPGDPAATPVRAASPVVLNGRIDPAGDEDRFVVVAPAGQRLHVQVEAADLGSSLDGALRVLGANDSVIATADDTPLPTQSKNPAQRTPPIASPDPSLDVTIPSGANEITLALRDLEGRGGIGFPYRIVVTPVASGFEVALNDPQVGVPKGGTAAVGVTVTRKGYNGPITLSVANPPAGLTSRPGTIPEGQAAGAFTIDAAPDASFGAVSLDVVGRGQDASGPIVAPATKAIVFATQAGTIANLPATLPINTRLQRGLAVAPTQPAPVKLETPEASVEVPHGAGAPIAVKVARPSGADGALALSALVAPPGVTVAAATVAEKAAEGTINVIAAPEAALGASTLVLVAKGKVAGADRVLALPAVSLNVVRPAAIELAAPGVEVKPGATAEIKGKVVRKGSFKEAVTIKLSGLPAGLKADPVAVPPDQSDFTARVVAEPNAAAASTNANVSVAFQINKKDYATPPTPIAVKVLGAK